VISICTIIEKIYQEYNMLWSVRYRCNCGTDILIDENLFIAKHFVDTLREDRPKLFKKIVEKIF